MVRDWVRAEGAKQRETLLTPAFVSLRFTVTVV